MNLQQFLEAEREAFEQQTDLYDARLLDANAYLDKHKVQDWLSAHDARLIEKVREIVKGGGDDCLHSMGMYTMGHNKIGCHVCDGKEETKRKLLTLLEINKPQ